MISVNGYYSEAHLDKCEKEFQEFFKNPDIMVVQFSKRVVVSGTPVTPKSKHVVKSVINGKYKISNFRWDI